MTCQGPWPLLPLPQVHEALKARRERELAKAVAPDADAGSSAPAMCLFSLRVESVGHRAGQLVSAAFGDVVELLREASKPISRGFARQLALLEGYGLPSMSSSATSFQISNLSPPRSK